VAGELALGLLAGEGDGVEGEAGREQLREGDWAVMQKLIGAKERSL
jgi:hypothetical protein